MNPTAKTLHLAPGATVYTRCVAEVACPYLKRESVDPDTGVVTQLPAASWSDEHFSLLDLAQAGGGLFASQGRTISQAYQVSKVRSGCFTVGTKGSGRTTTWSVGGFKLTKQQAKQWRDSLEAEADDLQEASES